MRLRLSEQHCHSRGPFCIFGMGGKLFPLLDVGGAERLGRHRLADEAGEQEHRQYVGQRLYGLHRDREVAYADPLQPDGDSVEEAEQQAGRHGVPGAGSHR